MKVNGNDVWSSGTLVINSAEIASFDMPVDSATLNFASDGDGTRVIVDDVQPIIHLFNFDSVHGDAATTNFVGADGSPYAGKKIFLTFAVYTIGAAANPTRVIHFTVVVTN